MMNYIKHLNRNLIKIIPLIFFLLSNFGCDKEPVVVDYVVKVNDSFLTREELASLVDTSEFNDSSINEVLNSWIHRELLFQEARREGILKEKKFNEILIQSERELAGAILIDKMLSLDNYTIDTEELKNYYEENISEFKIPTEAYAINSMEFIDEDKAISFRNLAVKNDWQKASSQFSGDPTIVSQLSRQFVLTFEIVPSALTRILNELYPQEISIVIPIKPGYYSVVQLIEKIEKGRTPPFEYIQNEVYKRAYAQRRQILVDEYLKKLYSNSDIEIKIQDKNEN